MANHRIKYLFERYTARTCTPAEKQELAIMGLLPENAAEIEALLEAAWEKTALTETMPDQEGNNILAEILNPSFPVKSSSPARIKRIPWRRIAVAASILLVIGLGSYFLLLNKDVKKPEEVVAKGPNDIKAPQTNLAMITLADGRIVYLDSVGSGQLAVQQQISLVKSADGKVVYSGEAGAGNSGMIYNTLVNPKGSKVIDMTLADGSKVWLNAGSSVTFPVAFVGNERKVRIMGEAYFEVAHDASKPFYVSKGAVNVQVLGTHFNVNAYDDEESLKVTLLEGSVRVDASTSLGMSRNSVTIKPGQQAVVTMSTGGRPATEGRTAGAIKVSDNVNIEEIMAWKNGKFALNGTELPALMRQVSRWYNVEVVMGTNLPDKKFGGLISRNVSLSDVLNALREYGINTEFKNGKLTVK